MLKANNTTITKIITNIVKKYNLESDITIINSKENLDRYLEVYEMARRGSYDYGFITLKADRLYLVKDYCVRFILIDDRLDYLDGDWGKIIEKQLQDTKEYWKEVKEQQWNSYLESLEEEGLF